MVELILIGVQIVGEAFTDKKRGSQTPYGMIFVALWFIGGGVLGFLSLLIIKQSIISNVSLRPVALIAYPFLAGLLAYGISMWRSELPAKHDHFIRALKASAFASGLLLVRYQNFS